MIRCIRVFTKYYVKGKVQGIRLIGEEAYLHIECNIEGNIQVIDVDEFKHGKKNREEQRNCYFEEALWEDFYYMKNWKELSLELCTELSHRLNISVEYIDLIDYENEQNTNRSMEKSEKCLQPHVICFFRQSELENNDIEKWGKEIFDLVNSLSFLPEKYQVKYIKKFSGKIEPYTLNYKRFIKQLKESKDITNIQINPPSIDLKKASISQLLKELNKNSIAQMLSYMIVFYSSLENKDSVEYYLKVCKKASSTNTLCENEIDQINVNFSEDFNFSSLEDEKDIIELFKTLVKWFRPDFGYVKNETIYEKRGFREKYFLTKKPSNLNWVNYFSTSIIEKIGLEKINELCRTNEETEFNNGILIIKKIPLDAESKEDLEFLYNAEKLLGLK